MQEPLSAGIFRAGGIRRLRDMRCLQGGFIQAVGYEEGPCKLYHRREGRGLYPE